jgi:predicted secreted protein
VGKMMDSFCAVENHVNFPREENSNPYSLRGKMMDSFCSVENHVNFPRKENSNPYFSSWEKPACSWKKRFTENIFEKSKNHCPSPSLHL